MCFNNSLTDLGFEVRLFDDLKAEDVLQKISEGRRLYIGYVYLLVAEFPDTFSSILSVHLT